MSRHHLFQVMTFSLVSLSWGCATTGVQEDEACKLGNRASCSRLARFQGLKPSDQMPAKTAAPDSSKSQQDVPVPKDILALKDINELSAPAFISGFLAAIRYQRQSVFHQAQHTTLVQIEKLGFDTQQLQHLKEGIFDWTHKQQHAKNSYEQEALVFKKRYPNELLMKIWKTGADQGLTFACEVILPAETKSACETIIHLAEQMQKSINLDKEHLCSEVMGSLVCNE